MFHKWWQRRQQQRTLQISLIARREVERVVNVDHDYVVDKVTHDVIAILNLKLAKFEATFSYLRAMLPKSPVEYQEYPIWLEHPQAADGRLPPTLVHTLDQEEEYMAKGYVRPGMADAGDFMLAKASAKLAREIDSWNKKYTDAMKLVDNLDRRQRELRERISALENPEPKFGE